MRVIHHTVCNCSKYKLLHCPFCNGVAHMEERPALSDESQVVFKVGCMEKEDCPGYEHTAFSHTRAAAARKWNTRNWVLPLDMQKAERIADGGEFLIRSNNWIKYLNEVDTRSPIRMTEEELLDLIELLQKVRDLTNR